MLSFGSNRLFTFTPMKIVIDFLCLQTDLKIKRMEGKRYIFCRIRKKYLVLQPEEMVRQLVLIYLEREKGYNRNHMQVEKGLKLNGLYKRPDIVLFDQQVAPQLIVECKAPNIPITQEVFDQIARYNLALKVKYLLVTNGIDTFCCRMNYAESSYQFLPEVPSFKT